MVIFSGIKGNDVIQDVKKGYRMPKPISGPIICPDPYYETMLKCWNKDAKCRPTFAYLQDFFENYNVAAEEMWKIHAT